LHLGPDAAVELGGYAFQENCHLRLNPITKPAQP
jgi:hypothetical protein